MVVRLNGLMPAWAEILLLRAEASKGAFMGIYYTICLNLEKAPNKMFYQQEKHEMFLGAHGLLAGLQKRVCLENKDLAERFLELYMPRLQARYGSDVQAEVGMCECLKFTKNELDRIKQDSEIARKRLETGILAANARLN
jgi:hypothetical protein